MTEHKRSSSPARSAVRNDLLRALLSAEYKHLRPFLERVTLKAGEVIYHADQRIEYVYFPENTVVAMIDTMEKGSTVEVGIIGHEGMVGINIFLGGLATPDRAVALFSGTAMRMKESRFRKEIRFGSPLQRLLLHYTQVFLSVISQSVGCSQHHTAAQRLARLLVTMHYYAEAKEFEMSQEIIAATLGVRRGAISAAAGQFQAAGMIIYSRGRMRIVDSTRLNKECCECYAFIRGKFDELLADVPKFLSTQSLIDAKARAAKE
jgi:CRP-like cAMP-binding protein